MSVRQEKLTGGTHRIAPEGSGLPQERREGQGRENDTLTVETVNLEPPSEPRDYASIEANIEYPKEQYIALLECDFECGWNKSDIPRVIEMWRAGVPGVEMARAMHRHEDEMLVLIMSLKRENRIRERSGAWEGKKKRKEANE